jgi:hypothetical protein
MPLSQAAELGFDVALSSSALCRKSDRTPAEENVLRVEKSYRLLAPQDLQGNAGNLALPKGLIARQRIGRAPPPLPMIVTCTSPFVAHRKNLLI